MPPFLTRALAVLLRVALGLTLLVGGQALLGRPADASAQSVRAHDRSGDAIVKQAARDRERGLRFRPSGSSQLTGLRYYRVPGDRARHIARLWSPGGRELARAVFSPSRETGWSKVALSPAVVVTAEPHVVSFSSGADVPYAVDRRPGKGPRGYRLLGGAIGARGAFPDRAIKSAFLLRPVLDAAATPAAFPQASNTGVPEGITLAPYAGPRKITTRGAVIAGRHVSGGLSIEAPGVVITNSLVEGNVAVEPSGSVNIIDSTIDGGRANGSAVGQYNITMLRVEVIGARQSVSCNANCDIQDSWLHAQYMEPGSDWHGDGFISNGGEDMLVRHNTLACDSEVSGGGGACSAAVALFADFNPLKRITIDGNLFTVSPAGYCLYGGYDPVKPYGEQSTDIVITDNVFQRGANRKCGVYGAVTAIAIAGEGNRYAANTWDDGARVRP